MLGLDVFAGHRGVFLRERIKLVDQARIAAGGGNGGRRRLAPLVAVNCGALPDGLIESELFGHELGAFAGALRRRVGHVERAHNGSLFLDEVESMPLAVQVKMLRVLEEREVHPIGANEPRALDLRVLASSKIDLEAAARARQLENLDAFHRNAQAVTRATVAAETRARTADDADTPLDPDTGLPIMDPDTGLPIIPTQGTWDSSFTINGTVVVVPKGTLVSDGQVDFVKNLVADCGTSAYTCVDFTKGPFSAYDEPWSHQPSLIGQITGPNLVGTDPTNFYLTAAVDHVSPDGGIHGVQPVPWETDALSVIGSTVLFGFGLWAKSKFAKSNKNINLD
jgi:hypothetical protein